MIIEPVQSLNLHGHGRWRQGWWWWWQRWWQWWWWWRWWRWWWWGWGWWGWWWNFNLSWVSYISLRIIFKIIIVIFMMKMTTLTEFVRVESRFFLNLISFWPHVAQARKIITASCSYFTLCCLNKLIYGAYCWKSTQKYNFLQQQKTV